MARHFLQLYLLIVATLAAVSWGQERLWEAYSGQADGATVAEKQAQAAALTIVDEQLHAIPPGSRRQFVADLAERTGVDLELFEMRDIAGDDTLARLARGEPAYMHAADEDWLLKRLPNDGRVLAFRYAAPAAQRGLLDWALALIFYAAIALVIMTWLWPLTRDLRQLERSTMTFGDRNWVFDARIGLRSPVYSLAEAFRRMAARIDSLIGSQKDMSNAMSHEIKTPLARMRFEIEMARTACDSNALARHLNSINVDIAELDAFVTATLDYAILERAEIALNVAEHDLTLVLPAITESVRRASRDDLSVRCEITSNATRVPCDAHLMETVLRNLLYNAIRYARREIRVTFFIRPDGVYDLRVDDDGPGIPEADRERIFHSFVQLDAPGGRKVGYGLGLAIVRRVVEWHGGKVTVSRSGLGGAGFSVAWGPKLLSGGPSAG
jgi:two-component system, OmpR family, sensor kinase